MYVYKQWKKGNNGKNATTVKIDNNNDTVVTTGDGSMD